MMKRKILSEFVKNIISLIKSAARLLLVSILTAALILFRQEPSFAQEKILFEKPFSLTGSVELSKAIWVMNQDTGEERIFFRIPKKYFTHTRWKEAPETGMVAVSAGSDLLIYSENGELLKTIAGVPIHTYDWSPDGTQISYCTGSGSDIPYTSFTGIEIMDFSDRSDPKKILHIPLKGRSTRKTFNEPVDHITDINWAAFDNNIYIDGSLTFVRKIKGGDVFVIRTDRHFSIEQVKYRSVYFSTKGSYYYKPGYEGTGFKVYDRETNKQITGSIVATLRSHGIKLRIDESYGYWRVSGYDWLGDDILLLKWDNINIVYSISENRLLGEFEGKILDWDTKKKTIYVRRGGQIVKEQLK